MKIILAFDSFKGSLSASDACRIARQALLSGRPELDGVSKPMADGGEGTAAAMMDALSGERIAARVTGPLPHMQIDAGFAWFGKGSKALVEMAEASGLTHLRPNELNPLKTTTYGTGQLIRAALDEGARHLWLAVGGSATVDGGVGAAMALGWQFLDAQSRAVGLGGGELERITSIIPPPDLKMPPVEVFCDVDNPLCGLNGAAHVFGPQKGATPKMVERLDAGLAHLARVVRACIGMDILDLPGAGAAGGLGAGAVAFFGGRLVSGIETVIAAAGLRDALKGADWVITGEGCFDAQSLHGKVVSGVVRAAQGSGARIAVIAGSVRLSPTEYREHGVEIALALRPPGMSLEKALAEAPALLAEQLRDFAGANLG